MASENHPVVSNSPKAVDIDKAGKADENVLPGLHGNMAAVDSIDPTEVTKLAADMQQRCQLFLDELEQFQAYLRCKKNENRVELRTFKASLQSEMRAIEKVSIYCHHPGRVYLLIVNNS
jgi:hypothetical protein